MSETEGYGSGPGRSSEDLIKEILKDSGWSVVETRKASDDGRAPLSESGVRDSLRLPDFLAQHHRHSERYVEVKSKGEPVHFGIKDEYRHGYEKSQHEDYLEYREQSGRPVYIFVHERKNGVILRQRVRNLSSVGVVTDEDKLSAWDTDEPIILFARNQFERVVDNIGQYLSGFAQDGLLKQEASISPFGLDVPGRQATITEIGGNSGRGESRRRVAQIIRTHKSIAFPELVRELVADEEMIESEGADVVKQLEAEGFVYLVPHDGDPDDQVVKLP